MDRVDRAKQHDLEHLPLPVAAAQTYYLVVGETPKQKSVAHLDRILNSVAHGPFEQFVVSGSKIPTPNALKSPTRAAAVGIETSVGVVPVR